MPEQKKKNQGRTAKARKVPKESNRAREGPDGPANGSTAAVGEPDTPQEPAPEPERTDEEKWAQATRDAAGTEPAGTEAAPAPGGPAPELEDAKAIERLARREEKARRRAAREEALLLKQKARDMLKESRTKERRENLMDRHMDRVAMLAEELGYDPDRPITEIPPLPAGHEEVAFHTIEEGRAFVRISYDPDTSSYLYEGIEPELTENERKILDFLRDTLVRTLDGRVGGGDWTDYLREAVRTAIVDHDILVDQISSERIVYFLVRDFLGYGPIDVMMRDPGLEDISCDGPGIPCYVFHRDRESTRTNVQFDEELDIDSFVIRLAQRSGKHISIADPLLDATLPDGSRLQATLSREVTSRGSSFTIRKFREEPFTPPDLVRLGTMSSEMAAYFWFLMEEGRSLIYAGGTASGKTTSLNAVCQFIPPEKKIVSIEDTREINLLHENWIAGITRSGFGGEIVGGKTAGTIDMYRLLEAALRQRPEYLLVGEVRGHEALTLFQAMATGHAVYSTMHADSVKSAVYRLENEPINVPRMMLQTLDTVAIQSQVRIGDKMARRVKEVVEIVGFDPDTDDLLTNTTFYWDPNQDKHVYTGHSSVFEQIRIKKGWSQKRLQDEWDHRIRVLDWLHQHDVRDFREVTRVVREYYRRPERILQRIDEGGTPHAPAWAPHSLDDGTKPLPAGIEPERIGTSGGVVKESMPPAEVEAAPDAAGSPSAVPESPEPMPPEPAPSEPPASPEPAQGEDGQAPDAGEGADQAPDAGEDADQAPDAGEDAEADAEARA